MRVALPLLVGAMALASTARADLDPPVIEHTPVTSGVYGESVHIVARVTDENEVFPPTLSWRIKGDRRWKVATMALANGRYVAQLKVAGDLEYWIEAYDAFGNGPSLNGSPNRPHSLAATVPAVVEKKPKDAPAVAVDTTPPVLVHTPVEEAVLGRPTTFNATITDEAGIFAPTLYYREEGATGYSSAALTGDDGAYSATLTLRPPFDYWIEAYDELGNGPSTSGSTLAPHRVRDATPKTQPLPVAALEPPPPAPEDDPFMRQSNGSPFKWWMGGAAGVVVAAAVGGVVYAIANDDGHAQWLVTQPRRR